MVTWQLLFFLVLARSARLPWTTSGTVGGPGKVVLDSPSCDQDLIDNHAILFDRQNGLGDGPFCEADSGEGKGDLLTEGASA